MRAAEAARWVRRAARPSRRGFGTRRASRPWTWRKAACGGLAGLGRGGWKGWACAAPGKGAPGETAERGRAKVGTERQGLVDRQAGGWKPEKGGEGGVRASRRPPLRQSPWPAPP